MYVGVPIAMPVAVSRESPSLIARAIPKSVTIGRPLPCVDEDVVGLDVAVDDAALVRVGERVGDVAQRCGASRRSTARRDRAAAWRDCRP